MIKKLKMLGLGITAIFIVWIMDIKIPCPFYTITGLYCPGCGITRCIKAILQLEFYTAFRYNPLIFIMLPFLGTYMIYKLYVWLFEKEDKITKKLVGYPMYIVIIILIGYGILRNTNLFSWMAPIEMH